MDSISFEGLKIFVIQEGRKFDLGISLTHKYADFQTSQSRIKKELGTNIKLEYEDNTENAFWEIQSEEGFMRALSHITGQGLFLRGTMQSISVGPWKCYKCSCNNEAGDKICKISFCKTPKPN